MKASIPSATSAAVSLFLRSTNSESGRGEAELRNGRLVARKVRMEHSWNRARFLGGNGKGSLE